MARRWNIVLDTNVLEAALRSRRGVSFALVHLVGTGRFEIALSVPLVLEYEEVLMRETDATNRDPATVTDLLDYFCTVGKWQPIFYLWRPLLVDPRDEMVLELAIAAGCDAIVTYNQRHFGPARQFGIRVLRPVEFLKEIGGES
jgi:predicted nucleic acid-binding protein